MRDSTRGRLAYVFAVRTSDAAAVGKWERVRMKRGAENLRNTTRRASRMTWERIKRMALRLGLPGVEETTSWGQPTLKAHGKLWVWWSPHEDAPVFKVSFEEREILVEAEPSTFSFTAHYKSHPLVLVRPEKLDLEWAKANLIRVWRAQAPKRMLKAYDQAQQRTM
jgi:hypothetical protein